MSEQVNGDHGARQLARGLGWFSIGLGALELLAPEQLARAIGSPRNDTLYRAYGAREIVAGLGLIADRNPAAWMWARVAGDTLDLVTLSAARESFGADRERLNAAAAGVVGVTLLDLALAGYLSAT